MKKFLTAAGSLLVAAAMSVPVRIVFFDLRIGEQVCLATWALLIVGSLLIAIGATSKDFWL